MFEQDREILRKLASTVKIIADKPIQKTRRELWRNLNSLKMVRPMVNVNKFMWYFELYPESILACRHPACRAVELELRQRILQDYIGDDTVIEPFVVIRAHYGQPYINTPEMGDLYYCKNSWGVEFNRHDSDEKGGAWAFEPTIKELDDFKKMVKPKHVIDEKTTAEHLDITNSFIGDILPVVVDRGPMIRNYGGSILHDLCQLRGYDNIFYDMIENPQWLHEVLAFMTTGVHDLHEACERAGDLKISNTFNQTMTYCEDLADPTASNAAVTRKELWHFFEGQEFDCVSPEMSEEFCFHYHKILAKEYGLIAYGCCENLTHKISLLRQFSNLRIIAVAPWADVRQCAEQIGPDYVMSWRPNPANTICTGFNRTNLKKLLAIAKDGMRGCNFEINLKDVKTIQGDLNNLKQWVDMAMDFVQSY